MPTINISVRDSASGALGQIAPNVRAALAKALDPLTKQMTQDVRAKALAHIHSFGLKPGLYLASIYGGVSDKDSRVSGYVRTSNQLAHLLEYGTNLHTIEIVKKKVLASADQVFGRIVRVAAPAYPAFDVLDARRPEIKATLTATAAKAAAETRA